MISAIKAVVLDWAGTTIDHGSRAPVVALLRLFGQAGVPITEAEARADMGRAKRDHIAAILAAPRVASAWHDVHGVTPGDAEVDRLFADLDSIMREAMRDCTTLISGAADLAARLRAAHIPIGSCTGYTRAMMGEMLPLAAAQGYTPDTVVCAGETKEGRPSPLMLWKALIDLGAWPASACVKVDDAPVGIAEGKAAGAWTVGVSASGNGVGLDEAGLAALAPADRAARIAAAGATLTAAGADYVIDSVADLWPLLETIGARIAAGEKPA